MKQDRRLIESSPLEVALNDVFDEVYRATEEWPPLNSCHEGIGVITEEFEELKEHVWMKQSKRDLPAMRREAIQLAAMAIRFAMEVCDEQRGRR